MLWEVTGPTPARCYINIDKGTMAVEDRPLADEQRLYYPHFVRLGY